MKPATKIGVVAGGYLLAAGAASTAVAVHAALVSVVDVQPSGGMSAFGDLALFVAVFTVTALVPSALALFFLRPYRRFWIVVSALGAAVAVTSILACVVFIAGTHAAAPTSLGFWAAMSVLRLLAAPLFALTFLVSALLSPYRGPRMLLFAACIIEGGVSVYYGLGWFAPALWSASHASRANW
jgi:hypothetical protein